jgi:hypothetical protein
VNLITGDPDAIGAHTARDETSTTLATSEVAS